MITPARLNELRTIESRMTKGPWSEERMDDSSFMACYRIVSGEAPMARENVACCSCNGDCCGIGDDDALGIAALRNAFPELLDYIAELEKKIAALTSAKDAVK